MASRAVKVLGSARRGLAGVTPRRANVDAAMGRAPTTTIALLGFTA